MPYRFTTVRFPTQYWNRLIGRGSQSGRNIPENLVSSYTLRKMAGDKWADTSGRPSFSCAIRPNARHDATTTVSSCGWRAQKSATAS